MRKLPIKTVLILKFSCEKKQNKIKTACLIGFFEKKNDEKQVFFFLEWPKRILIRYSSFDYACQVSNKSFEMHVLPNNICRCTFKMADFDDGRGYGRNRSNDF